MLPIIVVSALSLVNEIVKGRRQIRSGPEVLDTIWKAVAIELMKNTLWPTEFVGSLLEENSIVMDPTGLLHLEA